MQTILNPRDGRNKGERAGISAATGPKRPDAPHQPVSVELGAKGTNKGIGKFLSLCI
jgi:hypothetical protein